MKTTPGSFVGKEKEMIPENNRPMLVPLFSAVVFGMFMCVSDVDVKISVLNVTFKSSFLSDKTDTSFPEEMLISDFEGTKIGN